MLNPRSNDLLNQMTHAESEWVFPHLSLVSLSEGHHIYGPGDVIDQFYFPVTALLAIAKDMDDGFSIDLALIGKESAIGFRGLNRRVQNRVYVTSSGLAYRVGLRQLQELEKNYLNTLKESQLIEKSPWITRMFVKATESILDSAVLETGCAHFHAASERIARWLLSRNERSESNFIHATHQKIADSLGIRREAVTIALMKMRGIDCHRSQIEIKNRDELMEQSCECYQGSSELKGKELSLPFASYF
jgi:CRP-like cAMP-binding protein